MLGPADITILQTKLGLSSASDSESKRALNRRHFLTVTTLGGAGFLIGCGRGEEAVPTAESPPTPTATADAVAPMPSLDAEADLNAFVRIGGDNTVTVIVKHLDKGQGVTTGLPTIVAEELDADWSQMRAEFAPADVKRYANLLFGVQGTGGSTAIANSWEQLRTAAAGARAMLVGAAAKQWGVTAAEITISNGVVSHSSGRQANFGELAEAAAEINPPAEPALKDPSQFKLIGTNLPRLDSDSKTDGSAQFTLDVSRPGMRIAVVAHPPKFGATVNSFDASAALAIAGVEEVVQIPRGVAVVADSFWAAKKGRDALTVDWNFDNAETRGSAEMLADYQKLTESAGAIARNDGDVDGAYAGAVQTIESEFDFPFLAHATMEPMDCVLELRNGECEIWTGSQLPTVDQQVVAAITGLTPEQVKINTLFAGGSFGRRAVPDSDFIAEAAMVAQATQKRTPIKLQWTREDDMHAGRYRPMSYHRLRGGLDEDGDIVAWDHRIAIQSFLMGTPFEGLIQNGVDNSAVEGSSTLPYGIDNLRVDLHLAENGVPALWWRSVGHTQNAYVTEVFFDQLVRAAGKDPLAERQRLLADHPRHLGVLNLAAEKAGWGAELPADKSRGIAVHESFNSFVAQVAEVSVDEKGGFSVDRVVCAVDCGIAVNPDVVRAQMEGGIGYGLSAALREAVTLTHGEVDQGNFDRYRPLRINEMPKIEVYLVQSNEAPTGVGEPGTPVIAPAIANALMAATGKTISSLPMVGKLG